MTDLTGKQKKSLKALAHSLEPVVIVGQKGISESVVAEIDRALSDHELIKIKVRCEDQNEMKATLDEMTQKTRGELVQVIGHTVIIYRKNHKDPKIKLPDPKIKEKL